MDGTTLTAIIAAVAAVLGTQGFLKIIDVWGGRKAAAVEVELKLSGGWQQLADRTSARVTVLETEITRLQTEVMRLTSENAKLLADNTRMEADIADLSEMVKQLEAR